MQLLSEDITPNGSLRRRRSRVPSEEDDNSLMDYLRTSGHADGSRERKSTGNISNYRLLLLYSAVLVITAFNQVDGYGSLDRSWARSRARGSGGTVYKRRPDLMSADFSGGGMTPSPLAAQESTATTTLEPLNEVVDNRKSPRREWKPPIENTDVEGVIEAIESTRRHSSRLATLLYCCCL